MAGRTVRLALCGLIASVAVVAAGCGGGGGKSSSSSSSTQGSGGNQTAANQTLTMAFGSEPPSLDPGLATDTSSSNILYNIMDPLIKLGPAPALKPEPGMAESWDVNGATVTLHLRHDGKWTNGQPVTAQDYVYSWLRTISPELGADYAYQFFGIKGAADYNGCDPKKTNCDTLKSKVGITAPDKYTIKIQLTSPQPWFIQQLGHTSFLAVNKQAVEKWGNKWTEPSHIVTNGPFKLTQWQHNAQVVLTKWDGWRDASSVKLNKVVLKIIPEGSTAEQAFNSGEVDVDETGWPPADTQRLKGTPAYKQYPALGVYYYGFNVKNITDVNQRRAMAFAIDREAIVKNITQTGQVPATGFTPQGMPGFSTLKQNFLPTTSDMDKAKQFMAKVKNPKKNITLFFNNAPGHKEIAVAIQSYWKQLGLNVTLKQQDWPQFLQFLGPPPNKAVDVYRNGWIADYPDSINFLNLWECNSGNNNTNYCNKKYDQLVAQAEKTSDNAKRYGIYKQLEAMLTGPNGDMPIMPIYWYTYTLLVKPNVQGISINPMDSIDFTTVSMS
jgi:oligopeptide transport system substrate-binding protein